MVQPSIAFHRGRLFLFGLFVLQNCHVPCESDRMLGKYQGLDPCVNAVEQGESLAEMELCFECICFSLKCPRVRGGSAGWGQPHKAQAQSGTLNTPVGRIINLTAL